MLLAAAALVGVVAVGWLLVPAGQPAVGSAAGLVRSRAGRLSGRACSSVWVTGRRPTPACVLLIPLKPFGAAAGSLALALCPTPGMAGLALLPVPAPLARQLLVARLRACPGCRSSLAVAPLAAVRLVVAGGVRRVGCAAAVGWLLGSLGSSCAPPPLCFLRHSWHLFSCWPSVLACPMGRSMQLTFPRVCHSLGSPAWALALPWRSLFSLCLFPPLICFLFL